MPGSRASIDVSVAVAVHRSAPTLGRLVDEVRRSIEADGSTWEMVLVDDASGDGTWDEIVALSAAHPQVRGIRMSRNVGEDLASRTAIAATSGPIVVTLDDDLQQPPHELPRLVAEVVDGADVAYGVPRRLAHPPARRLLTAIWKRVLIVVADVPGGIAPTSFRAMRGELRDVLASDGRAIDPALASTRPRTVAVPVSHEFRAHRRSGYTSGALLRHSWSHLRGYGGPLTRWSRARGDATTPPPRPPIAERTAPAGRTPS
ncbi:MAG: glycosyltransferase [Acidimicrobiales bacterium]